MLDVFFSCSPPVFGTGFFSEPTVHWFVSPDWPAGPSPPSSCPHLPCAGAFYTGAFTLTSLEQREPYRRSHLSLASCKVVFSPGSSHFSQEALDALDEEGTRNKDLVAHCMASARPVQLQSKYTHVCSYEFICLHPASSVSTWVILTTCLSGSSYSSSETPGTHHLSHCNYWS